MNFPRSNAIRILLLGFTAFHLSAADAFDFAILGDRTGNAVPGVYEQITKEIAARRPQFVINVGDTIQGLDDATAVSQWDAVRPLWKSFGRIPFYLVPGNHDIWSPASERIWREQTGHAPHYSFDFQGAHVTVLDNSRADGLGADQLAYLEADLTAHPASRPKFVMFHRPFWLLPVKFQNGSFPLHQLARKYGVNYVISGHAHQFDRSEYQGVQYVMVGSSGGSLTHGNPRGTATSTPEGLYYGYAWVRVEGGSARLDFRQVEIQSGLSK